MRPDPGSVVSPEVKRFRSCLMYAVGLKLFPGAKLESASGLADKIDVKVVLGHDLGSL